MFTEFYFNLNLLCNFRYFFEVRLAGRTKWSLVFRKGTFVTNLHYVLNLTIMILKLPVPHFTCAPLNIHVPTDFQLTLFKSHGRTWIFIGEGSLHSGCFMPGFWCACRKVCCRCKWCLCWNGTGFGVYKLMSQRPASLYLTIVILKLPVPHFT
jgi:hypothetical protein